MCCWGESKSLSGCAGTEFYWLSRKGRLKLSESDPVAGQKKYIGYSQRSWLQTESKRAVSWGNGGLITPIYPHLSLAWPDIHCVMQMDVWMLTTTHMYEQCLFTLWQPMGLCLFTYTLTDQHFFTHFLVDIHLLLHDCAKWLFFFLFFTS